MDRWKVEQELSEGLHWCSCPYMKIGPSRCGSEKDRGSVCACLVHVASKHGIEVRVSGWGQQVLGSDSWELSG